MLTRTPSVRFTMFAGLAIAILGVALWSYCAASQIPEPKTEPKIIDPGDATRAPSDAVVGNSQARGNSGIFLQNRYEVQVLDSYDNKTYFHSQAGSIYKQYPPL